MLTNNFKKLMSFYTDSQFTNVLGETVSKRYFLSGKYSGNVDNPNNVPLPSTFTTNDKVVNGHDTLGMNSCFNYEGTINSNTYTQEKTSYKWNGVVCEAGTSGGTKAGNTIHNGFVLFVGTNDDEENEDINIDTVSKDDYCLNKVIELPVVMASCVHNAYDKTYTSRTFENNTGEDVTIREVGCYMFRCNARTSATSQDSVPIVMIGRKVLSNPVTIPVGEQRTFTYVIDMSGISFEDVDGE